MTPRFSGLKSCWALGLLLCLPQSSLAGSGPPETPLWWQDPAIPLEECELLPGIQGPEDLIPIPNSKVLLVSSARRGLGIRRPEGTLVRVDLSGCSGDERVTDCSEMESIYSEGSKPGGFNPVGLALMPPVNAPFLPESCRRSETTYHVLLMIDGRSEGQVRCLPLDASGRPTGEPSRVGIGDLGSNLNGLGVSTLGDVLATRARSDPALAFLGHDAPAWRWQRSRFRFANGVAFLEPVSLPKRDPLLPVLVADFQKREIHLYDAETWRGSFADGQKTEELMEPSCVFPAPGLPDNLHLWEWASGADNGKEQRLLVGTFGGFWSSLFHFMGVNRALTAAAWDLDLTPILSRLQRGDRLPEDCGIGLFHWRLLMRDDHSKYLSGASAAIKLNDWLVLGQLRRTGVLFCPWKDPESEEGIDSRR